jgi:4-aminobutyrate aminotransferase-like enzyme
VPGIAEVRGLGAMLAVELMKPGGVPDPELARLVQARALERGLLLLTCGLHGNVIRFLFPLTIPQPVFEEALGLLEQALTA